MCVLQTILIMHAMRRYPSTLSDLTNMPGRGTFTFLIIANLAAWIQQTMQVKELAHGHMNNSAAWLLLLNISLPLLLFYRFHSSVCFADVWHVAYRPLYDDVTACSGARQQPAAAARWPVATPTLARRHQALGMVDYGAGGNLNVPRIVVTAPPTVAPCRRFKAACTSEIVVEPPRSRSNTADSIESTDVILSQGYPLAPTCGDSIVS